MMRLWWALPDQLDHDLHTLSATEDHVEKRVWPDAWNPGIRDINGLDDLTLRTVFVDRLAALAADVLAIHEHSGSLPVEPPLDFAAGPDHLPLRYQLLDPDRFAISVDPQAVAPKWLQGYQDERRNGWDPCSPSAKLSPIYLETGAVVIDCAGRTVGTGR